MARIVITEFVSLDGVMEEPRWTFQFDRGPDGDAFKYDELFAASALLLGRVTYTGFAQAWPAMGQDDFGRRMNEIPKYVVSATLTQADATWGETTIISGDVVAEITRLKERPGDDVLLVEGSSQLAHTLIRRGLVDDYRLMVFPVILGRGKRLFPDQMTQPGSLTLTGSRTSGDGVLLLTYQPAASDGSAAEPGAAS